MERQDMANVLHALFTKGIEVNLEDETFEIIKLDDGEKTICKHFTDWINIFVDEGNVHPNDVEVVRDTLSIEHLREIKEPEFINYKRFSGIVNGEKMYINVSAFMIPSVKTGVMLLGIMPTGAFL